VRSVNDAPKSWETVPNPVNPPGTKIEPLGTNNSDFLSWKPERSKVQTARLANFCTYLWPDNLDSVTFYHDNVLVTEHGRAGKVIIDNDRQTDRLGNHFCQIRNFDYDFDDNFDYCTCNDYELFCCLDCRDMDKQSEEAVKCPLCIKVFAGDRGLRRHCILKHRHCYYRNTPPEYIQSDAEYARLCQRERRGQGHKHHSAARTRRAQERARAETGRSPTGDALGPTYDPCCFRASCHHPVQQSNARTTSGSKTAAGNRWPFKDVQLPDRRGTSGAPRHTSGASESTSGITKGASVNLLGDTDYTQGTSSTRADIGRTSPGNSGHRTYSGGPKLDNFGPQQGTGRAKSDNFGPQQGTGRAKSDNFGPQQGTGRAKSDNFGPQQGTRRARQGYTWPQQGYCTRPEEQRRSAKSRLGQEYRKFDCSPQEKSDHSSSRKRAKTDSQQLRNEYVSPQLLTFELQSILWYRLVTSVRPVDDFTMSALPECIARYKE